MVPSTGSSLDGLSDALSAGDEVYSQVAASRGGPCLGHATPLPCWAPWWAEGYLVEFKINVLMEQLKSSSVDDSSMTKDLDSDSLHGKTDLPVDNSGASLDLSGVGAPKIPENDVQEFIPKGDERILYVDSLSSEYNCSKFFEVFGSYGEIKYIKYCETVNFEFWKLWVEYVKHDDALKALKASSNKLKCRLLSKVPPKIDVDVVYPDKISNEEGEEEEIIERSPLPARWHIISTKLELYNIFHFKKHLKSLVGPIPNKDITRFGKNSFLVYTKSHRQGHMISKLKSTQVIKEVKPHYSFSYGKGVIFNQDIYDLSEKELLQMCEEKVWKFFKVPKSKMIIFTLKNDEVPDYLYIDRERFRLRTFKERPLQCFKCFGFGHSSKACAREQLCAVCSLKKHEGECSDPVMCINCKGNHSARSKDCQTFKRELAAVEKAHAEHLSIGQAKRLLSNRAQYSDIVKDGDHSKNQVKSGGHSKDQSKKLSLIPKPPKTQLPESQLEIHQASQPSAQKAPMPPLEQGASLASLEATRASLIASQAFSEVSQADDLPDLGSPQNNTLIKDRHKAQVHDIEMELQRLKRPHSPSSSPPGSSNQGKPPKRGNARSLEDVASSSSRPRPNISRPVNSTSGKSGKKPLNNK